VRSPVDASSRVIQFVRWSGAVLSDIKPTYVFSLGPRRVLIDGDRLV
jgi:hypothetical protein